MIISPQITFVYMWTSSLRWSKPKYRKHLSKMLKKKKRNFFETFAFILQFLLQRPELKTLGLSEIISGALNISWIQLFVGNLFFFVEFVQWAVLAAVSDSVPTGGSELIVPLTAHFRFSVPQSAVSQSWSNSVTSHVSPWHLQSY